MKILQSVENSYKDYKTKSENQRNYTKSNFTLDMMSDKLHSILSTIRVSEEIVLNLPKLKI
jgi:hypothetical protein